MAFLDPINEDLDRSIRLSFTRELSQDFSPLLNWLVAQLIPAQELLRARPSTLDQIQRSVSCILANTMYAAGLNSRCFVAVSLSPRAFVQNRYNQSNLGYRNFIRVVEALRDAPRPYLDFWIGFQDQRFNRRRSTRLRASDRLLRVLFGYARVIRENHDDDLNVDIIVNDILANDFVPQLQIHQHDIVERNNSDIIVLRNAERNGIEYEDTAEVVAMRNRLASWNSFTSENFHIDILLSDNELREVFSNEEDEEELFFGDNINQQSFVELSRTNLHRVFNNGSFNEGGRFYGAWWQSIPSRYRPRITINDVATIEIDYSRLHPSILYAEENAEMPQDAYAIDGLDQRYEELIKRTFLKLINARQGQRIDPPNNEALPENWTWQQLQDAIIEKHRPIARHLRSGAGMRLMRVDSNIAEAVMIQMQARDVLVLPVHDSFITYAGQERILREVMAQAYRDEVGVPARMKNQQTIERLFHVEGAEEQLENYDVVNNLQLEPGFEGYRARLEVFERSRTDAWHRRFGNRWIEAPDRL